MKEQLRLAGNPIFGLFTFNKHSVSAVRGWWKTVITRDILLRMFYCWKVNIMITVSVVSVRFLNFKDHRQNWLPRQLLKWTISNAVWNSKDVELTWKSSYQFFDSYRFTPLTTRSSWSRTSPARTWRNLRRNSTTTTSTRWATRRRDFCRNSSKNHENAKKFDYSFLKF